MCETYMNLGEHQKARDIIVPFADTQIEYLNWYNSLSNRHYNMSVSNLFMHVRYLQDIVKLLESGKEPYQDLYIKYLEEFGRNYEKITKRIK